MKTFGRLLGMATVPMAIWTGRAWAADYYSLQYTNWPPLPANLPGVPVLEVETDRFLLLDQEVDYVTLRQEWMMNPESGPPDPGEGGGGSGDEGEPPTAYNYTTNDLWLEMLELTNYTVRVLIHAPDTNVYDLFRTYELIGNSITNSVWRWVGSGTNGQTLSFPHVRCRQGFYVLGSRTDTDADALTDAFEQLVSKTLINDTDTDDDTINDRDDYLLSNILVNDPEQDCGNEQNSQFETTVAVVGTNVIVAWVDSNQGVYCLGADPPEAEPFFTNRTPQMVGYAVSRDGGVTFQDMDAPPLARAGDPKNDDGDAGDPVLTADSSSGAVYLVGTSPRNSGWEGIPVWKSTDGGITFANPVIAFDGLNITNSDKPWIAVDNGAGTGQHDVYLTCVKAFSPTRLVVAVATNGNLDQWNGPTIIREDGAESVTGLQSPIVLPGPDHVAYAFWMERTGSEPGTNWLKMRKVESRGTVLGELRIVRQLVSTDSLSGNLGLKRSNTASDTDTFRAFAFPVPAVNPATNKLGHLYVAFADRGTNANDRADIFFLQSTNGGATWTNHMRVNTDSTTNDQWMPVLAVKPDGTQLFTAWYDRRNDTNNSLIQVYGRFGTIATNGSVTFGSEFIISTTNFPPVFAGTLTSNTNQGHYDPVYPPGGVNLNWHYPEYPSNPSVVAGSQYRGHVGEYNGAWADGQGVCMSWTDYRLQAIGTIYARSQSDIRFARMAWPQ